MRIAEQSTEAELPKGRQLLLDGFEAEGLRPDAIRDEVTNLTPKELRFVKELISTGQIAKAAISAGYSPNSAAQIGYETLRKPHVTRFYQKCLSELAADAVVVLRRVEERARLWREKLQSCAQEVADLDEKIELTVKDEFGISAGKEVNKRIRELETRRDRMMRMEKHYGALAQREDELLGRLRGQIKDVQVATFVMAPDTREHLLALQREISGGRN